MLNNGKKNSVVQNHGILVALNITSAGSISHPPWSPDLILLDLSKPPAPKSTGALTLGLDASQERLAKTGLSGFEQNMRMTGLQKSALFQGKCMESLCKRPENAL